MLLLLLLICTTADTKVKIINNCVSQGYQLLLATAVMETTVVVCLHDCWLVPCKADAMARTWAASISVIHTHKCFMFGC